MMQTTSCHLMQALARHWIERRETQWLEPGSAQHDERQLEFFIGAATACSLLGAPFNYDVLLLLLAVGRDVQMLLPRDEPNPGALLPSAGSAGSSQEV